MKLRAGIDNYSLYPLNLLPMEMIRWAYENGAEGVAFSGYPDDIRETFTSSYLSDAKKTADDLGLYIEWGCGQHVPLDLSTFEKKDIYVSNRKAVGEACGLGVSIIRSCSGGLMRWKKDSQSTDSILKETARELKKQAPLFRDNGVVLAIETHFEFTTFELLKLFEMCETDPGDYLGICLDTMNLLTMLEEPVAATERILPWIVSTHIKDGGIIRKGRDFITFPAPIGNGVIDIGKIIKLLNSTGKQINMSVEDHGGSFRIPMSEEWFAAGFPDLSRAEYEKLLHLAEITSEKLNSSELIVTERDDWPLICESRTRNNIRELKRIHDSMVC